MATSGHGTWASIGGGVVALGAAPGAFGAYEVVGTGRSAWDNGWFDLGASLWLVGAVIVVLTAGHFVRGWWQTREGAVATSGDGTQRLDRSVLNVMRDEVGANKTLLATSVRENRWWTGKDGHLRTKAWRRHRRKLRRFGPSNLYRQLSDTYRACGPVIAEYAPARIARRPLSPEVPGLLKAFKACGRELDNLLAALDCDTPTR